MAVRIRCPHCDKSFRVLEEKLGKNLRCLNCREKFVAEEDETADAGPSFKWNIPSPPPLLIVFAALAVVGLIAFALRDRILPKGSNEPKVVQAEPKKAPEPKKTPDAKPPEKKEPLDWDPTPAVLQIHSAVKERTCVLRLADDLRTSSGKSKLETQTKLDGAVLEGFVFDGAQTSAIRFLAGGMRLQGTAGGKKFDVAYESEKKLFGWGPHYPIASSGILRDRVESNAPPSFPLDAKELRNRAAYVYECCSIAVPNRQVAPGETWSSRHAALAPPTHLGFAPGFDLTCTYQGMRSSAGKKEALVLLEGTALRQGETAGSAKGTAIFDLDAGYWAHIQLNLAIDAKGPAGPSEIVGTEEMALERSRGNPRGIVPTPPIVKGEIVLQLDGIVSPADPPHPSMPAVKHKFQVLKMRSDKAYDIYVENVPTPTTSLFHPAVTVIDGAGKIVQAYQGKNTKIRMVFEPSQPGAFGISIGIAEPVVGAFRVVVGEFDRD